MSATRLESGVASGDPTPTSVVLWGRVDGAVAPVVWTLTDLVGVVAATGAVHPDERGVLRAEVDGLQPGTPYRYEFSTEDDHSPVGRTRTLAEQPSSERLGVACCARWPSGEFTGYGSLADVDLLIHLGDYMHEDGDTRRPRHQRQRRPLRPGRPAIGGWRRP